MGAPVRAGEALDGLKAYYRKIPDQSERVAFRDALRSIEANHRLAARFSAENGNESEAVRNLRAAEGLAEFVRATEEAS